MISASTPALGGRHEERRSSDRLPLCLGVNYRSVNKRGGGEHGGGETINISSSGVLFTTDHDLIPGQCVELHIEWPARLNEKCGLTLVVRGCVVRCQGGSAALEIQHYEFRTHLLTDCSSLYSHPPSGE